METGHGRETRDTAGRSGAYRKRHSISIQGHRTPLRCLLLSGGKGYTLEDGLTGVLKLGFLMRSKYSRFDSNIH